MIKSYTQDKYTHETIFFIVKKILISTCKKKKCCIKCFFQYFVSEFFTLLH